MFMLVTQIFTKRKRIVKKVDTISVVGKETSDYLRAVGFKPADIKDLFNGFPLETGNKSYSLVRAR